MTLCSLMQVVMVSVLASTFRLANAEPTPTPHAHNRAFNTEEAKYSFSYTVDVPEVENFYDREEARSGKETTGRFRVALPDHRLQTVTYRADGDGYTAHISYDRHPSFESLRAAVKDVGPIGVAPPIGQPVVRGNRRGENWKNHQNQNTRIGGGESPFPPHSSHGPFSNSLNAPALPPSTQQPSRPGITPSLSKPVFPPRSSPKPSQRPRPRLPRPTPIRPVTTTPLKRPQIQSSRPTTRPDFTTTVVHRPTQTRRPTATTTPKRRQQQTSNIPRPKPTHNNSGNAETSIFVSFDEYEDPELLRRLIEAIRRKSALDPLGIDSSEEDDDDDDHGHNKDASSPRYRITNKDSVREKLSAIVHTVNFARI